ncbi:MAG: zinc-binding alcohol dehydrogenase [Hyphomicrobiales bacterium]|nr:MAG: zinc-binding alcohol dehydrogenase [Hyphomicrobiales bacterium]
MNVAQVIVTAQNEVELQERELDASVGPEDVLIQTAWTFISAGTELANYTGREPAVFQKGSWCAYPWNSGYANVGTVLAVGEHVTRCKAGDHVFTYGSHSSVVKASQRGLIVQVPDGMDLAEAAATRMAGVATSAVVMAQIPLHPWVVVFGLGSVGNLAAQSFRILGGRVIGVDPVASRRRLAERCGIQHTVGGTADEAHEAITKITGGRMADIAVDATGLTPVVLQALKATANVGQLVLLGSPRAPVEGNLTALLSEIHLRNITVRGALEWVPPTYPPVSVYGGRTLPITSLFDKQTMIFNWAQSGQMQVAPLVTHRLPPQQIKQAYEGLLRESETYVGVALDWSKV